MRKKRVFTKGLTALVISSMLVAVPTVSHVAYADDDVVTEASAKSDGGAETEASTEDEKEPEAEASTEDEEKSEAEASTKAEEASEAETTTEAGESETETEDSTEAEKETEAESIIETEASEDETESAAEQTTEAVEESSKDVAAEFEANMAKLKAYEDKLDALTAEDAAAIQTLLNAISDYLDANEASLSAETEAFLNTFTEKFNNASIKTVDANQEVTAENINAKIKEATKGDTIKLTTDINADVVIPEGTEIILEIPENVTLSNKSDHTITNKGTLTITGDGNVGNVKHGKAAIYNQGKLTIKGGTFARSSENGTYDPDQANGNSWYTVYNAQNATMNIEDGIFENSGGYSSMLDNWGVLFIEEGVFSGGKNTIKNDDTGVITIDGGNFSNKTQSVLLNWHELTINDGTFTAEDGANDAVINSTWCDTGKTATTNGTIVINGGEFIGDISDFEFSESQLENGNNKGKKKITIKGGNLVGVGTIEAGERTSLEISSKVELSDEVVIKASKDATALTLPALTDAEKGIFVGWISKIEGEETVKYGDTVPAKNSEFKQSWLKLAAKVEDKTDSDSSTGVKEDKVVTAEDTAKKSASAVVESVLGSDSETETDSSVKYELIKENNQTDEDAKEALQKKIVNAVIKGTTITTKIEVEPVDVKNDKVDEKAIEAIKAAAAEKNTSDPTGGSESTATEVWQIDPNSVVNIDVNMYIGSSNDAEQIAKITQLEKEVELSIEIPEELRKKANDYAVIRYHNGVAELLKATKSTDGTKVTFKSGKFSYYALAYKEIKKDDTGNGSTNTSTKRSGGGGGSSSSSVNAVMINNGSWVQDNVGWWFKKTDGSYPKDAWYECVWNGDSNWYHFNAQGYADGGWLVDRDGQKYYLHNVHDGKFGYMYTGWNQIADKWYYFNTTSGTTGPASGTQSKGSLVTDTTTADGYKVGADGAWIK